MDQLEASGKVEMNVLMASRGFAMLRGTQEMLIRQDFKVRLRDVYRRYPDGLPVCPMVSVLQSDPIALEQTYGHTHHQTAIHEALNMLAVLAGNGKAAVPAETVSVGTPVVQVECQAPAKRRGRPRKVQV